MYLFRITDDSDPCGHLIHRFPFRCILVEANGGSLMACDNVQEMHELQAF